MKIYIVYLLCCCVFCCIVEAISPEDCKDKGIMDKSCEQAKGKEIPPHTKELEGLISVASKGKNSVTVQWPALLGGEEYTVYVIESNLADKRADEAAVVKSDGASPGTMLSATVKNLRENVSYNIYISVKRHGKFFAYIRGIDVTTAEK